MPVMQSLCIRCVFVKLKTNWMPYIYLRVFLSARLSRRTSSCIRLPPSVVKMFFCAKIGCAVIRAPGSSFLCAGASPRRLTNTIFGDQSMWPTVAGNPSRLSERSLEPWLYQSRPARWCVREALLSILNRLTVKRSFRACRPIAMR